MPPGRINNEHRGEDTSHKDVQEKPEDWVQRKQTDISFSGFQTWIIIGLGALALLFALIHKEDFSRYMSIFLIMFVSAGCIGGCILSNRFGWKFGVVFLFVPIALLLAGMFFLSDTTGMRENMPIHYRVMKDIGTAVNKWEELGLKKRMTVFNLYKGGGYGTGPIKLIPLQIALSDYLHAPGKSKKPYRGYWYTFVKYDPEGREYTDIAGHFGICAFPEVYKNNTKFIYLMNESGRLFRKDLKGSFYIKQFPPPSKMVDHGWQEFTPTPPN